MPLFDYKCVSCNHEQEHFSRPNKSSSRLCPKCGSSEYKRSMSTFKVDVQSSDPKEFEKKIRKGVSEIYAQIGKESLNQDLKTAENIFGQEKVNNTFNESDD